MNDPPCLEKETGWSEEKIMSDMTAPLMIWKPEQFLMWVWCCHIINQINIESFWKATEKSRNISNNRKEKSSKQHIFR